MNDSPSLAQITQALNSIRNYVRQTPSWEWKGVVKDKVFGDGNEVVLKLELLQLGGSFKIRGAMVNILALTPDQLECGVTAVSAGNHAIAVAYAAKLLDSSAKVVMPSTANPYRVKKCEELGAKVVLMENVHQAFAEAERIQKEEGRTFVHPFEGFNTVLGTATCGLEFITQAQNLDLVIIPIGGGGLIAGMAAAIKQVNPHCKVIGVEPVGADTMTRSLKSGKPEVVEQVTTIADSLGAPYALPYSFSVVQKFVDEVMLISDQEMCEAMALLFADVKLAVEPAGAASTAALKQISRNYSGKRIGLMVCGANIDPGNFSEYLERGR